MKLRDVQFKDHVCAGVLEIGVPAAIGSFLMSASNIIMNSQVATYGDMAVAGCGAALRIALIITMICTGLGQGVQPLLGFCVGSKNWGRFKKIMRFSLELAIGIGVVLVVLCYIFVNQLVNAFVYDINALQYGVEFSRILLSTSALFGIFFVITNAIQAMGAVIPSFIINICRQGIVYIPLIFIMQKEVFIKRKDCEKTTDK